MGVREFSRSVRVADQIQRVVAELIARDLSDPRVSGVTVSGVDLSPDLRNAKILVTTHLDADVERVLEALNRASGFLRTRLARRVRMRRLPRLSFVHDPTLDNAIRVDALIDEAIGMQRGTDDGLEPGE